MHIAKSQENPPSPPLVLSLSWELSVQVDLKGSAPVALLQYRNTSTLTEMNSDYALAVEFLLILSASQTIYAVWGHKWGIMSWQFCEAFVFIVPAHRY